MSCLLQRFFIPAIWLMCWCAVVSAQPVQPAQPTQPPRTGTAVISGRVTIGNEPAVGVTVIAAYSRTVQAAMAYGSLARAVTDNEGRYRLTGLPVGVLRVEAFSPAYIIDGADRNQVSLGRQFTLAVAANIENVDFSLTPGGVITGRITDVKNRPMIQQSVQLWRLNAEGKRENWFDREKYELYRTDDRGVYRLYGFMDCRPELTW